MRTYLWQELSAAARQQALARPAAQLRHDVFTVCTQIIESVRRDGDAAVREFTERFDRISLRTLRVPQSDFDAADSQLTQAQHAALRSSIANVEKFHRAQMPAPVDVETTAGVRCERLFRPVSTVGLYVPAGSAPLPSAVIMLAIPARIAGCGRRILCTPPDRSGRAHPAVLVAARLCGVHDVFTVGGAQAIAALAYGTQSIPKADKIYGPGNAWVTAAKQLVAADPAGAACDMPAGPSEVMVIADDSARVDFVASDLLAQAEHDTQSQAILVTPSARLAEQVRVEVERQRQSLSRQQVLEQSLAASRLIVVKDLQMALDVANEYAPEHLILQIPEARHWLNCVRHAGSVFLGAWSPEPLGDYCSGTNHVLPTFGHARTYGGLSVPDFLKSMTVQELTPAGLSALGPVALELARLEGLDAHASAVAHRLRVLQ